MINNNFFIRAGYVLHSAIHAARPDINAVIHLHYGPCVAVSAMKQGLMLCCQESCVLGHISYHDYRGLLVNPEERADIVRNLGPSNKVFIFKDDNLPLTHFLYFESLGFDTTKSWRCNLW